MNSNKLYIIYEKTGVFGKPQKGLKLPILNPEMIEYVREHDMYFIPNKRIIGELYPYPGEYEIKMSCGWQPSYHDPDNRGLFPPSEPEGIILHNPYLELDREFSERNYMDILTSPNNLRTLSRGLYWYGKAMKDIPSLTANSKEDIDTLSKIIMNLIKYKDSIKKDD